MVVVATVTVLEATVPGRLDRVALTTPTPGATVVVTVNDPGWPMKLNQPRYQSVGNASFCPVAGSTMNGEMLKRFGSSCDNQRAGAREGGSPGEARGPVGWDETIDWACVRRGVRIDKATIRIETATRRSLSMESDLTLREDRNQSVARKLQLLRAQSASRREESLNRLV